MKKGEVVSHYRILEKIGEGGMGEVFAAFDETLQRKVALKTISSARRLDLESRARFRREARILSQLDHPSICRIYDYVAGEASDLLVLELVEGRDLHSVLREGIDRGRALDVCARITDALVAAHSAGIVHRDIKPANVMLTSEGGVKVLDFGLARSQVVRRAASTSREAEVESAGEAERPGQPRGRETLEQSLAVLSTPGSVSGTLCYMSPEQARGAIATTASDMYALGLLFQEIFTGRPAYPRDLEFSSLLERVAEGRSEPVALEDKDLARLIQRLKSPAPADRPTALETAERLRWIRARSARRLRMGLALGVLAAAALGALKYTLDLQSARSRAEMRRAQAEGLLTFMLEDLYDKLEPLGKTAVLSDVGNEARAYFDSVPEEELSEEEIQRKAAAFVRIGQVRRDQGDLASAVAAFEKAFDSVAHSSTSAALVLRAEARYERGAAKLAAGELDSADDDFEEARECAQGARTAQGLHRPMGQGDAIALDRRANALVARSLCRLGEVQFSRGDYAKAGEHLARASTLAEELVADDPTDANHLFDLGQCHFWSGYVHWEMGRKAEALELFRRYLSTSERLVSSNPEHAKWRIELSYAQSNLGTVLLEEGNIEAALARFRSVVESWRGLVDLDPLNRSWLRELADALSWLGSTLHSHGRLGEALDLFREELATRDALVARDRENEEWKYLRTLTRSHLGNACESLGLLPEAQEQFERAVAEAHELSQLDAKNLDWQRNLGVLRMRLGRSFLHRGDVERASGELNASQRILRSVYERDENQLDWRLALTRCEIDLVDLGLARGELERARLHAESALALVGPPELQGETADRRVIERQCLVQLELGRIYTSLARPADAERCWTLALGASERLCEGSMEPSFHALRVRVLAETERLEEARRGAHELDDMGYGEPSFVALCRANGLLP